MKTQKLITLSEYAALKLEKEYEELENQAQKQFDSDFLKDCRIKETVNYSITEELFNIRLRQLTISNILVDIHKCSIMYSIRSHISMGQFYQCIQSYELSIDHLKQALSTCKELKLSQEIHMQMSKILNSLALSYIKISNFSSARTYLENSLSHQGEESITSLIFETYNLLGMVEEGIKKYDKALEFYYKVWEIAENLYGKDSVYVAEVWYNIACVNEKQHEYSEAIKYIRRCLENYLSSEKLKLTRISFLIKIFCRWTKISPNYMEAIENLKKIEKRLTKLIEIHNTSKKLKNCQYLIKGQLGMKLKISQENNSALQKFQEELEIGLEIFGGKSIEVARTLKRIGRIYCILGNLKESKISWMKALEIFKDRKVQSEIDVILQELSKIKKHNLQINIDKIESQEYLHKLKNPFNRTSNRNEYDIEEVEEVEKTN